MSQERSFFKNVNIQNLMIGRALNEFDKEKRHRIAKSINEESLGSEMKKILSELLTDDFSFVHIFVNHGMEVLLLALKLANEGVKKND